MDDSCLSVPASRLGASDLRECSYMRWINAR
jgi:hypothetical protein